MSTKSTQRITRAEALTILGEEIPALPNDALAELLETLADFGHSKAGSQFDNFIVSDFAEDNK